MTYTFECEQCHESFTRSTRRRYDRKAPHRFCGAACRGAALRKPPDHAECHRCGRVFPYSGARTRYRPPQFCSVECRAADQRARQTLDRPFPLKPLLDLIDREPLHSRVTERFGSQREADNWFGYESKERTLVRRLQILGWTEGEAAWYVRGSDGLTLMQADKIATAVGYHPAEVWPDLWWRHE